MGCEVSKLNSDICLKDETQETHTEFRNSHGLSKFYKILGNSSQEPQLDDHSDYVNIKIKKNK